MGAILTLLRMASGFLVAKFIAVYAGPTGMAMYGQLQSFVNGINGLVTNQVGQGIVRYTAENKKGDNYDLVSHWWKAATSLLILLIGVFFPIFCLFSSELSMLLFNNNNYSWLIILTVSMLPFNVANNLLLSVLNGFEQNKKNIITSLISVTVSTSITLVMLYKYGIEGGLISVALNNAIAGIIVIYRVRNEKWFTIRYWFGRTNIKYFKNIWMYILVGVVGAATGPTALITIRNMLTESTSLIDTGIWQSMMKISDAYIAMIITGIGMYYFPKAASIKTSKEIKNLTIKTVSIISIMVIFSAGTIFLLRDIIISILFDASFENARELFLPQLTADFFRVVAYVPALIILAKGYFKVNIFLEVFINILLVVSSYYLIPIYGALGVTYSWLITYIIYSILIFLFFCFHIKTLNKSCLNE
jgi:PST family polysaccharide transporter